MGKPLEVADEVREYLPAPMVVEAEQAAERGDLICPICEKGISRDDAASLLVFEVPGQYHQALSHRTCRPSQIEYIRDGGSAALQVDRLGFTWHAILRGIEPRAVLLWENKTNFDGMVFGGDDDYWTGLEVVEWQGFEVASMAVEELVDAPRAHGIAAIHRRDFLEVLDTGRQWHHFPVQPYFWRFQANYDGEILLLNGTALGLDQYDADHVDRRIEAGQGGRRDRSVRSRWSQPFSRRPARVGGVIGAAGGP